MTLYPSAVDFLYLYNSSYVKSAGQHELTSQLSIETRHHENWSENPHAWENNVFSGTRKQKLFTPEPGTFFICTIASIARYPSP